MDKAKVAEILCKNCFARIAETCGEGYLLGECPHINKPTDDISKLIEEKDKRIQVLEASLDDVKNQHESKCKECQAWHDGALDWRESEIAREQSKETRGKE